MILIINSSQNNTFSFHSLQWNESMIMVKTSESTNIRKSNGSNNGKLYRNSENEKENLSINSSSGGIDAPKHNHVYF